MDNTKYMESDGTIYISAASDDDHFTMFNIIFI